MRFVRQRKPRGAGYRTWTALITVDGYLQMPAPQSPSDEHDDQIMAAAHEVHRLMRSTGADYGQIDLFRSDGGRGAEFVEWRIVTLEESGLVVSANQKIEPYRDPVRPATPGAADGAPATKPGAGGEPGPSEPGHS